MKGLILDGAGVAAVRSRLMRPVLGNAERGPDRVAVAEPDGLDVPESELIAAARSGDFDSFALLITRYRRLISTLSIRLTVTLQDAEDAVQEIQLAVWRGIGGFEGNAKFSTWLYQVAYHTIIGQTRRRVPEPVAEVPEELSDLRVDARVCDVDAVRWALSKLPEDYRVTLVLKECFDVPVEEIAEILTISTGTVKSRLSRARHAVVYLLKERVE